LELLSQTESRSPKGPGPATGPKLAAVGLLGWLLPLVLIWLPEHTLAADLFQHSTVFSLLLVCGCLLSASGLALSGLRWLTTRDTVSKIGVVIGLAGFGAAAAWYGVFSHLCG
jgi:hypothetical protein